MAGALRNAEKAPLQPATAEFRHLSKPEEDIQVAQEVFQKHAPYLGGLPIPKDIRYVHLSHKTLATVNVVLRHAYEKLTKDEIKTCQRRLHVAQKQSKPFRVTASDSSSEERLLYNQLQKLLCDLEKRLKKERWLLKASKRREWHAFGYSPSRTIIDS